MNRKIFFAIILSFLLVFFGLQALGAGQYFRVRGFFLPDDTWSGGHPGIVTFELGSAYSGYSSVIDVDGYLSGYFWLGNVGWSIFNHGAAGVDRARIICPPEVFRDPTVVCSADGYAWSENAGWISLSGAFIDNSSGVYYSPSSGIIQGFGHSTALGYVPFYASAGTPVASGALDQSGISLDGIGINFIGKIAIVGNIAGTRIYSMTNQNVGYVFNTINQAEVLNTIRKNLANISRNIPQANLSAGSGVNFIYQKNPTYDYDTSFGWIWPTGKRSIIIEGRDIYLNQQTDIGDSSEPTAIIALKNEYGSGGNIIISNDVERIYSFLYAEGSIFSGEKPTTSSPIISYISSGAWNIPAQQLYIYGGLISRNTIGGSLQTPSICPVATAVCDVATSQLYDLNYFRTYDYTDPSQQSVPYTDVRFQKSSVVIEYNNALTSNPPPGVDSVLQ